MSYRRPEPLARRHELDAFGCGEPALDEWLKKHARAAHASETARVFVTTESESCAVVGYYALAASHVEASEATARAKKGSPAHRPVPAVLLARLAVDSRHQGVGLGRSLLQDVLLRCAEAADAIGVRLLLVHSKHEQARAWYQRHGFEESPTDPLHLMILMKDVRAFIERHAG